MERYDITVYDSARKDIREVVRYLSKTRLEPDTAHGLLLRFQKEILSLANMPERYPLVSDPYLASLGFRVAAVGNYLIFYTVRREERKVDVVRVIYGRRNWTQLVKNEL